MINIFENYLIFICYFNKFINFFIYVKNQILSKQLFPELV